MARRRQPVGANIDQFSHFSGARGADPVGDTDPRALTLSTDAPDVPDVQPAGADIDPPASSSADPGAGDALAEVDELLGRAGEPAVAVRAAPATVAHPRAARVRRRGSRRADLILPDKVMSDLRELGRPERTGAQRTIGAKFFAACYVRAVHELIGDDLDTTGLDGSQDDETVERVKRALLAL